MTATRASSSGRHRAAATPAGGWTTSTRATACRSCSRQLDLDRSADVDAAIVAYPHGAAAPVVAELRERGVRVVDLSADFRLRDPATYERWYGEHGAPELLAEAVYGLTELHRDADRGRGPRRQPGLLPDRRRCSRSRRSRGPG